VNCKRGSFAKAQRVLYGCSLDVLKRRYNGRDSTVSRPGPPPTLGADVEAAVAEWCLESTRSHCSQTVSALLAKLGKVKEAMASTYPHLAGVTLGRKWLQCFLARHPELGRRKAELIETARMSAVNRAAMARYFLSEREVSDLYAASSAAKVRRWQGVLQQLDEAYVSVEAAVVFDAFQHPRRMGLGKLLP